MIKVNDVLIHDNPWLTSRMVAGNMSQAQLDLIKSLELNVAVARGGIDKNFNPQAPAKAADATHKLTSTYASPEDFVLRWGLLPNTVGTKRRGDVANGSKKNCYRNSWAAWRGYYTEGFISVHGLPIQHGWRSYTHWVLTAGYLFSGPELVEYTKGMNSAYDDKRAPAAIGVLFCDENPCLNSADTLPIIDYKNIRSGGFLDMDPFRINHPSKDMFFSDVIDAGEIVIEYIEGGWADINNHNYARDEIQDRLSPEQRDIGYWAEVKQEWYRTGTLMSLKKAAA